MEDNSVYSHCTKSSSTSSKALAARAELEMAKTNLQFIKRENKLKEARLKLELEEQTFIAEREVAMKEAAVKVFEEMPTINTESNAINFPVSNIQADPVQRTKEYVEGLSIEPQFQTLDPNPLTPSLTQISNLEKQSNYAEDIMRYFVRKDLIHSSMVRFSDLPKDYRAWKRSFNNSIKNMRLNPDEEIDLLVRWLGPASSSHANRLRTVYLNNAHKGLQEIWKRLEKTYGSPEIIEDSLFEKIIGFPRIYQDYHRLRELSDLLLELQAAKDDGDLPGLGILDTARGLRPIVEKLPSTMQEQWTSHGTDYKRKHQVPFPPFTVFVKFIEQQADDRNDPGFRFNKDPRPTGKSDESPQSKYYFSTNKTQIMPESTEKKCPIHNSHHSLRVCRTFRNMPIEERRVYLKQKHLCLRCSSPTHTEINCKHIICTECGSKYHGIALHPGLTHNLPTTKAMSFHGGERNSIKAHCTNICGQHIKRSCSKICLVHVYPDGQKAQMKRMYAVIDEHSNRSLAHPKFFELFHDQGPKSPYSLKTCSGVIEKYGRRAQGYRIESLDGNTNLPLPTLIECADVPDNRSEIPTPEVARHHKHLSHIAGNIPQLDETAPILILLGRDIIDVHKVRSQINGSRDEPYAQKLDMGWVIIGNVCLGGTHKPYTVNTFFTDTKERGRPSKFEPCSCTFQAKDIFYKTKWDCSIFQLPKDAEKLAHSIEDETFLDIMKKEVRRGSNGSCVVPLPFKSYRRRLPNNQHQVFKRLNSLTRQFNKRPQLQQDFFKFIQKINDKNPADSRTRAIPAHQLPTSIWLNGPLLIEEFIFDSAKYNNYNLVDPENDIKRLRGSTQFTKMADLPIDHLSMKPPFTNVGLDVFGPWSITTRKTRGCMVNSKSWAALFTCMSTRTVHIEVLESMDISILINALIRFFCIRGPVKIIRSDQRSNLVGASSELKIDSTLNTNTVKKHLSDHGCTWLFNPPHAPYKGGVWERMIGIAKRILNAMLLQHGSTRLTHKILITFLAEVAAIINNRPLIPISSDPEDPTLVTPSILLTQKVGFNTEPIGQFTSKDIARRQWRYVQHLAQTFWKRWKDQYLPLLQVRRKWTSNVSDLKPGSIVLLKDLESKRNEWPLGLITRAIPSKDGKVRQVEVKIHKKEGVKLFLRPITDTVLLISPNSSNPAL